MTKLTPVLILFALSANLGTGLELQWSTPEPVAQDSTTPLWQSGFALAGRDTTLWVCWCEDRGTGFRQIKASQRVDNRWLPPETVASDSWLFIGNAKVAVDYEHRPWLVWAHDNWPDSCYLLFSHREADTWTCPMPITKDTAEWGYELGIAPDPEEGIWAIWRKATLAHEAPLFASHGVADSWISPSIVTVFQNYGVLLSPVITVPPSSKPRAAWSCTYNPVDVDVYSSTWNGDTWGPPEPVFFVDEVLDMEPSLCHDTSGTVWVAWNRDQDIYCARHDSTGWTDSVRLDADAGHPSIYADPHGWIWALWSKQHGLNTELFVRYYDGSNWSEPSVVVADSQMGGYGAIAVSRNRIWVVWSYLLSSERGLLYSSYADHPLGVVDDLAQPDPVMLGLQTRCNPIVGNSRLDYELPFPARVRLHVYDASGRIVSTLVDADRPAGRYSVGWPASHNQPLLPAGIYFARLGLPDHGLSCVRKIILTY